MASQAPVAPFLVSATFSPTLAMIAGISSLETQPHSPSRRGILFVCSDLLFANVPLTDGFPILSKVLALEKRSFELSFG